jgi:hypothetical protein
MVKEISGKFKIPQFVIRHLVKKGTVSCPFNERDMEVLRFLGGIYRDDVVLRALLAKRSVKERNRLIRTAGMDKIELYIYSRFSDFSGRRLTVSRVASELASFYDVPISKSLIGKIYKIRRKVYNDRYRK